MCLFPLLVLAACTGLSAEDSGVDVGVAGPVDTDPRFVGLLEWTAERIAEWDVPGVAIVIVEDGAIAHLSGVGVRTFGEAALVTPDTLFRVASLSKMVTGILAARAVDEGRLALDAPASDAVGDLALQSPHSFADLTLLQLLSHTSGLQTTGLPNACDPDPTHLQATFADLTPDWALWTPPAELYNYANQGFGLAGLAVERAGGELFVDQAQEFFDAAGMGIATYDSVAADAAEHATGHTMNPATHEPLRFRGLEERACVAGNPSGGLIASARDLGSLAAFLLAEGESFLTADGYAILTTEGYARSETTGYGFGLQNTAYAGYPSLAHHGSLGGFLAMLWVIPSEGLGVGVLVNADHHVTDPWESWSRPSERIMEQALNTYLGVEPEARVSTALPVSEWGRFAGHWRSAYALGDVTVTYDGAGLTYSAEGEVHDLLPYSAASFHYPVVGSDGRTSYPAVSFRSADDDGVYRWVSTGTGVAGVVEAR